MFILVATMIFESYTLMYFDRSGSLARLETDNFSSTSNVCLDGNYLMLISSSWIERPSEELRRQLFRLMEFAHKNSAQTSF